MTISMFDLRTLLMALEQIKPAQTFFLNTFFTRPPVVATTKIIDVDIVKGKRRIAPFVHPKLPGRIIEREGFSTLSLEPPTVKPKMITTAQDIVTRAPGNTIYAPGASPAQLAQQQLGKDLRTLMEMILRREEWMAVKAITTGEIPVVGDGYDTTIDFGMAAAHLVQLLDDECFDQPTANILQTIEDYCDLVVQDSGLPVDYVIAGSYTKKLMFKNELFLKQLQLGQSQSMLMAMNPENIQPGARFLGMINQSLPLYDYHEWYLDDTVSPAVERPLIASNQLILGSSRARCDRYYGLVQDLKVSAAVPYFPKVIDKSDEDPSVMELLLQSSPLPVPTQSDAFVTLTVTEAEEE